MKRCFVFALLLAAVATPLIALDRNAFTVIEYQLNPIIDRNTHVVTVDGRLALRNDSKQPQKNVTLQISSSLQWGMIYSNKQQLEYLAEKYTSDIDHTGSLSEAIVTLNAPVAPGGTISIDVQYGGTITADASRLTRMGVPQETALHSDWDQIGEAFTAVRGLGYVVWYPVSLEAVSMSDSTAVSDAIAAWKERHRGSVFVANISVEVDPSSAIRVVTNLGGLAGNAKETISGAQSSETSTFVSTRASLEGMGTLTPAFAVGVFDQLQRPDVEVLFSPEHASLAKDYAVAAEANQPLLNDWLPPALTRSFCVIELTDPDASPYQDGPTLFTPIRSATEQNLQLLLLPTQVAARFVTARRWMEGGIGVFLQATLIRDKNGRDAALKFLGQYEAPLAKAEELARASKTPADGRARSDSDDTLLVTSDELYLRAKSGFVFWMLRDLLGDSTLQHALAAYRSEADKFPTYFQKLLEAQAKRELEWFFDDWVYRDRGLPDFRVASAYSRKLLGGSSNQYQVTATIENFGAAGAEVPVLVQTAKGEKSVRVLVRAHDKGYARIELPEPPTRIVANDGSVPESNTSNNVFQFTATEN